MSFLICDRCGDVTVDSNRCWCGETGRQTIDLGTRRRARAAVKLARVTTTDDSGDRPGTTRAVCPVCRQARA
jgi:hypothetical protein